MAGVVAGSIAGWSPIGKRDEEGSAGYSQSDGRSQLEGEEDVEIHPGTSSEDPIITRGNTNEMQGPPSQVPGMTPGPPSSLLAPPSRG